MKRKYTYRKVLNKGYKPCWYHTDRGIVVAWIEKTGRKYIYVRFNHDGRLRRLPLSEQRYFTPFKSKRG